MGGRTRIILQRQKGGPQNVFAFAKGGPEFVPTCKGGDQKKLATGDHIQTAPLLVKNDSSLRSATRE